MRPSLLMLGLLSVVPSEVQFAGQSVRGASLRCKNGDVFAAIKGVVCDLGHAARQDNALERIALRKRAGTDRRAAVRYDKRIGRRTGKRFLFDGLERGWQYDYVFHAFKRQMTAGSTFAADEVVSVTGLKLAATAVYAVGILMILSFAALSRKDCVGFLAVWAVVEVIDVKGTGVRIVVDVSKDSVLLPAVFREDRICMRAVVFITALDALAVAVVVALAHVAAADDADGRVAAGNVRLGLAALSRKDCVGFLAVRAVVEVVDVKGAGVRTVSVVYGNGVLLSAVFREDRIGVRTQILMTALDAHAVEVIMALTVGDSRRLTTGTYTIREIMLLGRRLIRRFQLIHAAGFAVKTPRIEVQIVGLSMLLVRDIGVNDVFLAVAELGILMLAGHRLALSAAGTETICAELVAFKAFHFAAAIEVETAVTTQITGIRCIGLQMELLVVCLRIVEDHLIIDGRAAADMAAALVGAADIAVHAIAVIDVLFDFIAAFDVFFGFMTAKVALIGPVHVKRAHMGAVAEVSADLVCLIAAGMSFAVVRAVQRNIVQTDHTNTFAIYDMRFSNGNNFACSLINNCITETTVSICFDFPIITMTSFVNILHVTRSVISVFLVCICIVNTGIYIITIQAFITIRVVNMGKNGIDIFIGVFV